MACSENDLIEVAIYFRQALFAIDQSGSSPYPDRMNTKTSPEIDAHLVVESQNFSIPTGFKFGKKIGTYQGHVIHDKLTDDHGVVREYKGIVLSKLGVKPGAIIAGPGLLYEPVI